MRRTFFYGWVVVAVTSVVVLIIAGVRSAPGAFLLSMTQEPGWSTSSVSFAAAVGLVGLLRMLPSVVAAPFAATLGDRYPRQRVILVVNVARTVALVIAAAVALAGMSPWIIYLLSAVIGLLQSVFRPTQAALLPALARTPAELTAANLVLTTIEGVGIFLGPAIGGLLLAVTSPAWTPASTSRAVDMPTASTPHARRARISAGVS